MAKKYTHEWWLQLRPEDVGKETERLVERILREKNGQMSFTWHRFPDSRAARRILAAQPSDYLIVSNGLTTFLEVKALKHEFRLPSDRVSQLAVLKKFELAGARAAVLVHHYTTSQWRLVGVNCLEFSVPSWDLRDHNTFSSCEEALQNL